MSCLSVEEFNSLGVGDIISLEEFSLLDGLNPDEYMELSVYKIEDDAVFFYINWHEIRIGAVFGKVADDEVVWALESLWNREND